MNKKEKAVGRRMPDTHIMTILGVLLITLVQNNLNMLGVPTSWQIFAVGLVLLLGAVLSSIQAKRIEKLGKI